MATNNLQIPENVAHEAIKSWTDIQEKKLKLLSRLVDKLDQVVDFGMALAEKTHKARLDEMRM